MTITTVLHSRAAPSLEYLPEVLVVICIDFARMYNSNSILRSRTKGFHRLRTTPVMVTSSPALHLSTKSSSNTTKIERGIEPTASLVACKLKN